MSGFVEPLAGISVRAMLCAAITICGLYPGYSAAQTTDGEISDEVYSFVNNFIRDLENGNSETALAATRVPAVAAQSGYVVPDPKAVVETVQGCDAYQIKYARNYLPNAIVYWRCADNNYSTFLRPSRGADDTKVVITAFGELVQ